MSKVLDLKYKLMEKRKRFSIPESAMPYVNRLFLEAGIAGQVDPKSLAFPVYMPTVTQGRPHKVLCPDFMGMYPMHFAMLGVASAYDRFLAEAVKSTKMKPEEFAGTPMGIARQSIHAYTKAAMIMNFLTPGTFLDTQLLLVFNEGTGMVEVWSIDLPEVGDGPNGGPEDRD